MNEEHELFRCAAAVWKHDRLPLLEPESEALPTRKGRAISQRVTRGDLQDLIVCIRVAENLGIEMLPGMVVVGFGMEDPGRAVVARPQMRS